MHGGHLAVGDGEVRRRGRGRSRERSFVPVDAVVGPGARPAHVHDVETRLHTKNRRKGGGTTPEITTEPFFLSSFHHSNHMLSFSLSVEKLRFKFDPRIHSTKYKKTTIIIKFNVTLTLIFILFIFLRYFYFRV